jgi:hypothetical protein
MFKGAGGSAHVNPALSAVEIDALLQVLDQAIIRIRQVAGRGDAARAEAIADAIHNVPRLLLEGQQWGWTIAHFRDLFLLPLVERYPELAGLEQPLDGIARG